MQRLSSNKAKSFGGGEVTAEHCGWARAPGAELGPNERLGATLSVGAPEDSVFRAPQRPPMPRHEEVAVAATLEWRRNAFSRTQLPRR